MIRIYLTRNDIEGFYEFQYSDSADENDIRQLIKRIDKQKEELSLLLELLEEVGKEKLLYWYRVFDNRRKILADIEAGEKYREDNSIQGTWYKDSFEKLDNNKIELGKIEKEYKSTSSAFRKYIAIMSQD